MTVLFGDGAGVAVVSATDSEHRILDSKLHADGTQYEVLMVEAPASRLNPRLTPEMLEEGLQYPQMDGRTVFRNAVTAMPEVVHRGPRSRLALLSNTLLRSRYATASPPSAMAKFKTI